MRVMHTENTIQHYIAKYDMASFLNDDLLRHLQLFQFEVGTNVYVEQGEQHYLYFLVDGTVQCSHYHLNGRMAVYALSRPFTVVGDLEILTDEPLWGNVIADQHTVMLGIAREVVHRYGADDPKFLRFLIEQLRTKLLRSNDLQKSRSLPLLNRLAWYMLSQPHHNNPYAVILPSKEELASLLGTTTRHLNRVLKQLVEERVIDSGYPYIRVTDLGRLRQLPNAE